MSGKNSIQVAIKVRPLLRKEKDQQSSWRVVDNSIQLIDSQSDPYYFDHIFDQDVTNQTIFDKLAKPIVHSAIKGFNGTIFAYGQTSSGKTYTMMGDDDNPGVMVLAAKEIFKQIERTSDRQFLLRVGYIEIYNEKIYDLLNKKNQDLKIHETTGTVSVNCEEIIIQCEEDLLSHLKQGTKERTVGETNMNERSSRSHAIFRIIIESRKMDRSGDDAIIHSVINLVDLAGSERADQTGARGTRLKEGGHINKSLLFLSNVIKRLSENEDDKYISFRDSKLTRILQASLGGNALTAIICTIKPNAVEETQSSLSFALRAKAIKNKPQVNETVSDATMMKRLEHEIKVLKTRLEEEQRKNESQIKVRQLEQRIKMEDLKIISCNSLLTVRNREKRRRTWCPSSKNLDESGNAAPQPSALPVPLIMASMPTGLPPPSRLQAPKKSYYNTPLITMRPTEPPPAPRSFGLPIPPDNLPEIDEEFAPAELVNFEMLSPMHTPKFFPTNRMSITPISKVSLEEVQHNYMELQMYTNLENLEKVTHEPELALKQRLESLTQRNAVLENERIDYIKLKDDIVITTDNLIESQKRYDEIQIQLSKLKNSNSKANETISKYEQELAALKLTNEKLEMENREAVNLDFEFQRHKNKSKLRENELLEALNEKDKEITKLEKSLTSITSEKLQNSKQELLQISLQEAANSEEGGSVCIKCEDLQRLLEENKKVISEFEKLTLEYEKLKLNYTEIEKENETHKLKINQLEELQQKENAECERLQTDVQSLREKLQSVQSQYEQLSTENSSKRTECLALNRQVELARQEMVVLEEKFTKLEVSWQEQQQTINDIERQYATIRTKYDQLQNQYELLENTRGQSLTDCQRLEKENVELQTEIEDLKYKVQDAQQKLLENIEKSEEFEKEQKAAYEEKSTEETTKSLQENEKLQEQLLELQTQFENLQKEYDDLSNQLMDNLQDSESLKLENSKLEEKLKSFEDKNAEVSKAEAELNELKTQLENVLTSERKSLLKTPSPCRNSSMRSSGVCVEEEEEGDEDFDDLDMLRKFSELSESLIEIELEHSKGKTKVFRSSSKKSSSTPNNYKLYLKNILGVRKTQKDFDMEIENIHLQGSFKHHSFHIVELTDEENYSSSDDMEMVCDANYTNGCDNVQDYIEKLKHEINELKALNEHERLSNKSLLDSTERALEEMREQIQYLQSTLSENQQQIVTLEKEKADITLVCEELQEKVNCTLNGSFTSLMNITANLGDIKCLNILPEEKLKDLENFKLREKQIIESFDSQTKMLEELTQRNIDMECELQAAKEKMEAQESEYKELQLEIISKLELSAAEYRDNMKKYNKEWEERREAYEQTIHELNKQLESFKQLQVGEQQPQQQQENNTEKELTEQTVKEEEENDEVINDKDQDLKSISDENIEDEDKVEDITENFTPEELIVYLKQEKLKLEEEKQTVATRLSSVSEELENLQQESYLKLYYLEEQVKNLTDENLGHLQEQALLDSRLKSLEELLKDCQELHKATCDEKAALETQVSDLQVDLSCIPQLHEKVHVLFSEKEQLHGEYKKIQQKLQDAESQIQEFCKEDTTREEIVQTLQNKLSSLNSLEAEKQMLINDLESLQSNFKQLQDTLENLQEKEAQIAKENDGFKLENSDLRETTEKLSNSCSELELEKSKLEEKLEKLLNSETELALEKTKLEEKLLLLNNEFVVLQEEHERLGVQLRDLNDEKKSLLEQKSLLNDEKTTLEEQLKCLKEKEKAEELLEQMIKDKAELSQKHRLANEKLEELEKENAIAKQEKTDLQHSLQSLQENIEKEKEKVQELEQENAVAKQEKIDLQHSLQSLQEDIEKEKEKVQELEKENAIAKQEKTDLQHSLQSLQEDIEKEKEKVKEKVQEIEQENAVAKQEKIDLQHSLQSLQEDIEKEKEKVQELEKENTIAKQEKTDLQHSLQTLQEDIEREKEKVQDLEKEIAVTKQEKIDLHHSLQMLQEEIEKEKEKAHQEKSDLHLSLEKLQEDIETEKEKAVQAKQQLHHDLQSIQDSLSKTIQEKHEQLQEIEQEKELTKQENLTLQTNLETLKADLKQAKQDIEQQLQQIAAANQDSSTHHQHLQMLNENLSKTIQDKQQQFSNLESHYKTAQEQNLEMENELQTLKGFLIKHNEERQQLQSEKDEQQQELVALKASLKKLEEDKLNLQEKLLKYQNLQKDKSQLEATINTLKSAQHGAVNNLQKERDNLQLTLQQYEHERKQFKEKEETLNHKIETLSQQLHEVGCKANNYQKLLQEHEEVEQALTLATTTNQNLQQQIFELSSQQQQYVLNMENQTKQIDDLQLELNKHQQAEQIFQQKLKHLKETLEGEKSTLQRKHQDLQSYADELKLKCDSLEASQSQLQQLNLQLEQQFVKAKENLSETKCLQDELNSLKEQHKELQNKMQETVEEAGRCSHSLREDLENHKQLLEQQLERYNALGVEMDTKEKSLRGENEKLLSNIATLQIEKQLLEDKIREITVRNFEQDLQRQAADGGANMSIDSNTSLSPRTRKSLERLGAGVEMKATNLSIEEKLSAIQQKNSTTADRKNRRLSTHDERRRQSYWGVAHDKETMTDPMGDTNCNCVELDRKLKDCERNLFIKSSQVTALNMELKNHPLKDENAVLMKRLQEEQDKSRIEIKRCKQKLYEQTAKAERAIAAAAHATAKSSHAVANAAAAADVAASIVPKVMANAEVQTDCDLNVFLQKLQGKYDDLKNICRYRHNLIKELEGKVSEKENSDGNTLSALEAAEFRILNTQNESLKKELKTLKEKYEYAKVVLTSRREEIQKLRAQLGQTQS